MKEYNNNSHLQSSSHEILLLPDDKHFLKTAEFYSTIPFAGEGRGESAESGFNNFFIIINYFILMNSYDYLLSLQWDHSSIQSSLRRNAVLQQHS